MRTLDERSTDGIAEPPLGAARHRTKRGRPPKGLTKVQRVDRR